MGSNRHMTNSASQPQTTMQTHTPSGSNPCTATTLENSTLIKREPVSDLDLGLSVDCQTESWAESYQDLSSWCNATSACSPATCQSPVTDETFIIGSDFQGLIDFDLRKSEEIASVPVDEVGSFNLWGSEGQQSIPSSVLPSVGAASSTLKNESVVGTSSEVKAEPVLLHDCWLFEVDREEGLKRASASKQFPAVTSSSTTSTSQHLIEDTPSNNSAVKSESSSVVAAPQQLLPDSVKMAELQRRLERIASHTHPGADSKEKAAELLKILQRQITTLNKKKYNSPAAVADLPHTGFVPQIDAVCSSGSAAEPCYVCPAVTSAPSTSNGSDNLFQSDPFDGLFNLPEVQGVQHNYSQNLPSMSTAGQSGFSHNLVTSAAPFVSSTYQLASSTISSQSRTNGGRPLVPNVFNEAHQEVLKSVEKVDPHITDQLNRQQVLEQLPQILMVQMPQHLSHQQESQSQVLQHQQPPQQHSLHQNSPSMQRSFTLALKKEPPSVMKPLGRLGMPELELNFDALLFEQAGLGSGLRVPEISTPEVLKPLVDVPDAEGFDLLSYVCDDKACTPPVVLENNPFHFPQLNTSQVSVPQITFPDRKQNIMVVKPMHSENRHISNAKLDSKENAVIVQVQPELMPSTFMEDDEEVKEVQHCSEFLENKLESTTARPVRSPRKRKLSDDFIVEAAEIEEVTRPGRRRRIASSRHDSDDEYVLPVRRTRKKTNIIIEDDDEEEDIVVKKRPKTAIVSSPRAARGERTVSTSSESDRYRELRDRNNEASRKSRLTRKAREQELGKQADVLTKENRILKVKVDEMENLVKKLREALLQSMMKKTSN